MRQYLEYTNTLLGKKQKKKAFFCYVFTDKKILRHTLQGMTWPPHLQFASYDTSVFGLKVHSPPESPF